MGPADDLVGRSEDKIDQPPFVGSKIDPHQAIIIVQPGQGNEREPAKGNAINVHRRGIDRRLGGDRQTGPQPCPVQPRHPVERR